MGVTPDEIARTWLRLVIADAEISPYLIGVDLERLAAHLAAVLDNPTAVHGWPGLGLSEAQHRRMVDYLTGVLWALDLPEDRIAQVTTAVSG
ncbi:hypothetical protein ACPFP2_04255 [Micromonospora citrea]|uniref:hypothetical protein n=1 Tax=Micromonospora citrea TaxID=47855 RepID=UPI003C6365A7